MATNDEDVAELSRTANALVQKVDALGALTGETIVDLGKATKSNRRMIWIVAVCLLMQLVLTVLVLFGLHAVDNNSKRLDAVTSRLDKSQTEGRQKALCPLYTLFMQSKSEAARAANPQGPAAYDRAFKVIEQGYKGLHCQDFVGKGPTLGP